MHPQSSPEPTADDVFEVVFVCTGNRARSPLAERLFLKYATDLNTRVSSFGTSDVGPLPPLPQALEAARRLGVELGDHRARPLSAARLASADLVVGFEPFHVSAAVIEGRADVARAFLLGELVPLLDVAPTYDDPYARARSAIMAADSRRIRSRPDASLALADPLGRSAADVDRIAGELDALVEQLVNRLFRTGSTAEAHETI